MNRSWKVEFAARFQRHADELKWLYCELYHNDMEAYEQFTDMLYECWIARSEALRSMDRERRFRRDQPV